MAWEKPHISKVYEALTAIADSRAKLVDDSHAICVSTEGNKTYQIEYDPLTNSINSNDDSAFYSDFLSYPMIAFLMLKNLVTFDRQLLSSLQGIKWSTVNQKYKNNYDLAINEVLTSLAEKGLSTAAIESQVEAVYRQVCDVKLEQLGPKRQPPLGF